MIAISDREFGVIRNIVYKNTGINLTEEKRSLVIGRLYRYLKESRYDSFTSYCNHLLEDRTGKALNDLVNRITTNFTYFYRESRHFDFFTSNILPEMITRLKNEQSNDLRIWCAGCATGEEPYTLAILMLEFFGNRYSAWDAGVLATDISEKALRKAISAIYSSDSLRKVPSMIKRKYFRKVDDRTWQLTEEVKKEVLFRRFNLINNRFPFKKPFHTIFCRNVMIYFDHPTRLEIIKKFHDFLVPGGYLIVSHSESLGRSQDLYRYVMPGVYQKPWRRLSTANSVQTGITFGTD